MASSLWVLSLACRLFAVYCVPKQEGVAKKEGGGKQRNDKRVDLRIKIEMSSAEIPLDVVGEDENEDEDEEGNKKKKNVYQEKAAIFDGRPFEFDEEWTMVAAKVSSHLAIR